MQRFLEGEDEKKAMLVLLVWLELDGGKALQKNRTLASDKV